MLSNGDPRPDRSKAAVLLRRLSATGPVLAALLAVLLVSVVALARLHAVKDRFVQHAALLASEGLGASLAVGGVGSGSLLGGVVLYDIAFRDEDLGVRAEVDSARIQYGIGGLLRGSPEVRSATLWSPVVVSYGESFPPELPASPGEGPAMGKAAQAEASEEQAAGSGESIRSALSIVQLRIVDGRVVLPDAPGGEQRVQGIAARLAGVNVDLAAFRATATLEESAFEYAGLAGAAVVTGLRGSLAITPDSALLENGRLRMPGSDARVRVAVTPLAADWEAELRFETDGADLADLAWLDPRLAEGRASGSGRVYLADTVRLDLMDAEVAVAGGLVRLDGAWSGSRDSVRFEAFSAEAEGLPTTIAYPWIFPSETGVDHNVLPTGVLSGDARLDGSLDALRVTGDALLARTPGGPVSLRLRGEAVILESGGIREADAEIALEDPSAVLEGVYAGAVLRELDGVFASIEGDYPGAIRLDVAAGHLSSAGARSQLRIQGSLHGGRQLQEVDMVASLDPLDASIFGGARELLAPDLDLQGAVEIRGPARAAGVSGLLESRAGPIELAGSLDLLDLGRAFEGSVRLVGARLDQVFSSLPEPSYLTGELRVDGGLTKGGGFRGVVSATAGGIRLGAVQGDTLRVEARAESGAVEISSFELAVGGVRAVGGGGSLGMTTGAGDSLKLRLSAPSLAPLRPLFMPGPDRARDELSPLEREIILATGGDPDTLPLARDIRFGGAADLRLTLSGSLDSLTVRLSGGADSLFVGAHEARRVWVDAVARGVGVLPQAERPVGLSLDGVVRANDILFMGRRFDWIRVRSWSSGRARLLLQPKPEESYDLQGVLRLTNGGGRLDVDRLTFDFGEERWNLQGPAVLQWDSLGLGTSGLSLVQRSRRDFRFALGGRLALRSGESDLDLDIRDLDMSLVRKLMQWETEAGGDVSGELSVRGPWDAPEIQGEARWRPARYGVARLEDARAVFSYADGEVDARVDAATEGRQSLWAQGFFPVRLPLPGAGAAEPGRVSVDIFADSLPVGPLFELPEIAEEVEVRLSGSMVLEGTSNAINPDGTLELFGGSMQLPALGARPSDLSLRLTFSPDRTILVDGGARLGGELTWRGMIDAREPTNPSFDLAFLPRSTRIAQRRDLSITLDGDSITLSGDYRAPIVGGSVRLVESTVYLEEFQRATGALNVRGSVYMTPEFRAANPRETEPFPFVDNLRADIEVHVGRGNWLRSEGLSVEAAGVLDVRVSQASREVGVEGALDVVRGTISYPPRTFTLKEGSFVFDGSPSLDATLNVLAETRVRDPQGRPRTSTVRLGGSLLAPELSLSSEYEDAISSVELQSSLTMADPLTQLLVPDARGSFLAGTNIFLNQLANQLGFLLAPELGVDHLFVSQPEQNYASSVFGSSSLQVEAGRRLSDDVYLTGVYRRGYCSDRTLPVNSGGVRMQVYLPRETIFEGFLESSCTRAGYRGIRDISAELQGIWGVLFLREWSY